MSHLFLCSGIAYDVRFSVTQVLDASLTLSLSAAVNVIPDFTAIAATIAESTEITTALGQWINF